MKNLFLTSYFAGVAQLIPEFYGSLEGKKVVFIPTASIVEKVTFYIGTSKKAFAKLGATVDELEVSKASKSEIENKIHSADIVFVDGGNTFFLLQELKRTGADVFIKEHIAEGKLYISASAGSMVVCPDIEYVKLMDDPDEAPDLQGDFSGLHVVDFSIVPHCTDIPFKKAAEKIIAEYGGTLDLKAINNRQAIAIIDNKVSVVTAEK